MAKHDTPVGDVAIAEGGFSGLLPDSLSLISSWLKETAPSAPGIPDMMQGETDWRVGHCHALGDNKNPKVVQYATSLLAGNGGLSVGRGHDDGNGR